MSEAVFTQGSNADFASRPAPAPATVHVLPPEPFTAPGDNSFPFRAAIYNAKFGQSNLFKNGAVFQQDQTDDWGDVFTTAVTPLPALLSRGYRSLVAAKALDRPQPPLTSAPPDVLAPGLTREEAVALYIRGLPGITVESTPHVAPWEIYRHVVLLVYARLSAVATEEQDAPRSTTGSPSPPAPAAASSSRTSGDADACDGLCEHGQMANQLSAAPLGSPMEGDVFTLAFSLSTPSVLTDMSFRVLTHKLLSEPLAARALPSAVVQGALDALSADLGGSGATSHAHASTQTNMMSLLGLVVSHRGRVRELLRYLHLLDTFCNTNTSIVPVTIPFAGAIAAAPFLNAISNFPILSPFDCFEEEPETLPLTLPEGARVRCFCVSPDRRLLCTATQAGLTVFSLPDGQVYASQQSQSLQRQASQHLDAAELPDLSDCWYLSFADDSNSIIASLDGLKHYVMPLTLHSCNLYASTQVSVPVGCGLRPGSSSTGAGSSPGAGQLELIPPPYLPFGSQASLFLSPTDGSHESLSNEGDVPTATAGSSVVTVPLREGAVEGFSVCCHVYDDFAGTVVRLVTAESHELSVKLHGCTVTLVQRDAASTGLLPATRGWRFLHVRWLRGAWSLSVDHVPVDLRGARADTTVKSVTLRSATCFRATGHLASLVVWAALHDDHTAAHLYARKKRLDGSVTPLIHFPLDEGEGDLIKETAAGVAHRVAERYRVFDRSVPLRYDSAGAVPTVRLGAAMMLEASVLVSAFRVHYIFPASLKGQDDLVVVCDRKSNVIVRSYRSPGCGVDKCFAVLRDESELFTYHHRFSALTSARLQSPQCRLWRMEESGLTTPETTTPGSAAWLADRLYRRIHAECFDLLRVPLSSSPLQLENLKTLASLLRTLKTTTNKLKVLAVLSLTLVHFRRLISADEAQMSSIASSLKDSCSQVLGTFAADKVIVDVARELHAAATHKSLTLADKAALLRGIDQQDSVEVVTRHIVKDDVVRVVLHMARGNPQSIVETAEKLLRQTRAEEPLPPKDKFFTRMMFWFVLSAVYAASIVKQPRLVTSLLQMLADEALHNMDRLSESFRVGEAQPTAEPHQPQTTSPQTHDPHRLSQPQEETPPYSEAEERHWQHTVFHSALIPLLFTTAEVFPEAGTEEVEGVLCRLLELPSFTNVGPRVRKVAFPTRDVCDVYPSNMGGGNGSNTWRFETDFSGALHVVVGKDPGSPPVLLTRQDPQTQEVQTTVFRTEPYIKVDGGVFFFSGADENKLILAAQYELEMDVQWINGFKDTVIRFLVNSAQHGIEKGHASSEMYIAPILRNGLTTDALAQHAISIPDRYIRHRFPLEVLEASSPDAQDYLESVYEAMRGSIVESMKPAIRALLSVLLHCGVSQHQARDEVKLGWFSGEWGSRLQGPTREATQHLVVDTARWIITRCVGLDDGGGESVNARGTPGAERRSTSANLAAATAGSSSFIGNDSQNTPTGSRSASERRSSQSARRGTARAVLGEDYLEQLRALLARETGVDALETALVERTHGALHHLRSLRLLNDLAQRPEVTTNQDNVCAVIRPLYTFAHVGEGMHYTTRLLGAGTDLEMAVRSAFHHLMNTLNSLVLHRMPEDMDPIDSLTQPSPLGRAALQQLPVICIPWDVVDGDVNVDRSGNDSNVVAHVSRQMEAMVRLVQNIPRTVESSPFSDGGRSAEELEALSAVIDLNHATRLFANDFSVSIATLQISRSEDGVIIEKDSNAPPLLLRADCGWPMQWREGSPRLFYFETTMKTSAESFQIGLVSEPSPDRNAALEADAQYFYASNGTAGAVTLPRFAKNDTVGCGVITTTRRVFFTLNGRLLGFTSVAGAAEQLLFPALRFVDLPNTKVLVNFGTSPFSFDYRWLHPVNRTCREPTWYRVAHAASLALHFLTIRGCRVFDAKREGSRRFLEHCCNVVSSSCAEVAAALTDVRMPSSLYGRTAQSILFSVAEDVILGHFATLRHVVSATTVIRSSLPAVTSTMIFELTVTMMLLPLSSVRLTVLSLLPEVIVHVTRLRDPETARSLVETLFQHANTPDEWEELEAALGPLNGSAEDAEEEDDAVAETTTDDGGTSAKHENAAACRQHSTGSSSSNGSATSWRRRVLPEGLHMAAPPALVTPQEDEDTSGVQLTTVGTATAARANGRQALHPARHRTHDALQHKSIFFQPTWCECDTRSMYIANSQYALMLRDSQRSIVLGCVLPRTGVVSFSVKLMRDSMVRGNSLKGGYFIGVSVAGLTPLSPTSNSQSWRTAKPPIVWAMHDTTPQLPHATNPSVRANKFYRAFGSGDVIRVVVNRDRKCIDFYRDDEFLETLFTDVPQDVDLVPFAQLYNDDAVALIMPGTMTTPVTTPVLLGAASVDVLRTMLTLEPFQRLVAAGLSEELRVKSYPKVFLSLFNSVPNPTVLQLRNQYGEEFAVRVTRISDTHCSFTIGSGSGTDYLYNLRLPPKPKITCGALLNSGATPALEGFSTSIERLVAFANNLVLPLVSTGSLCFREEQKRKAIVDEESDHWDFLFHGKRVGDFLKIQELCKDEELYQACPVPRDYTFSTAATHPEFYHSPYYCKRLVYISGPKRGDAAYMAIAEPSIPLHGRFSIRCVFARGQNGQILGGGYFFGVCSAAFRGKPRDLNTQPVEAWALPDMDDAPWRPHHMCASATFPIVAEPKCIIVSGDIVRLEIDREERTIHAFRKPINGEEIALGLIYDYLPQGELFPYVQLMNIDAAAALLPSDSSLPAIRLTQQRVEYVHASMLAPQRSCSACAVQNFDTKLSHKWYKCNECADYVICRHCFDHCNHSLHSFTELGDDAFICSTTPPASLQPGTQVVMPGGTSVYLRSSGCKSPPESMRCVVESTEPNAFAIWGLVCSKGHGRVTMKIDTVDGAELSTARPTFVGVGSTDMVRFSRESIRKNCYGFSDSCTTFCSDETLRKRMDHESRFPFGFRRGATINIEVDLERSLVTFFRDWVVVGTQPLRLGAGASGSKSPQADPDAKQPHGSPTADATAAGSVCVFVFFGDKNTRVSIFPELRATLCGRVRLVKDGIALVESPAGTKIRYTSVEDCRLPLTLCRSAPAPGSLVYTFTGGNKMLQCRVLETSAADTLAAAAAAPDDVEGVIPVPATAPVVEVEFIQSQTRARLHLKDLLVTAQPVVCEERAVKEQKPIGATVKQGFVISRILLILSCLCENETLSPIVMQHSQRLLPIISELAAIKTDKETAYNFIEEMQSCIALTADALKTHVRTGKAPGLLPPFIPDNQSDRRRRLRPDMIVSTFGRDTGRGSLGSNGKNDSFTRRNRDALYTIVGWEDDRLRLRPLVAESSEEGDAGPAETVAHSYRRCLPVRHSGRSAWYTVENGLPCSTLEYARRAADGAAPTGVPPKNYGLEGEWQASMVRKSPSESVWLRLTFSSDNVGEVTHVSSADTSFLGAGSWRFLYRLRRYERLVSILLFPAEEAEEVLGTFQDLLAATDPDAGSAASTTTAGTSCTEVDGAAPFFGLEDRPNTIVLAAAVDVDGLRVSGTWRHRDHGATGTLLATRQHLIVPPRTDSMEVSPLPDFADAPAPTVAFRTLEVNLHRLIVFLARHLHLVMWSHSDGVPKEVVDRVHTYSNHPLVDRVLSLALPSQIFALVCDSAQRMLDPLVPPWCSASLAQVVMRCFLSRHDLTSAAPAHLTWDCLHAVVATAHRCGSDYRGDLLRGITAFLQTQENSPTTVLDQLFPGLLAYLNSSIVASTDLSDMRKDLSSGVDLILAMRDPLPATVYNVPIKPLRCLIDICLSLHNGAALPNVEDFGVGLPAASRSSGTSAFADGELRLLCPFGELLDNVLKVGKVTCARACRRKGKFYYEVRLPDRISAPFAVGWGTSRHSDVPSQHVGSDHASFSFNGSEVASRGTKEEYQILGEVGPGAVVGCLLNMDDKTVAWSIEGTVGSFISIPITIGGECLYPFASISSCQGMAVRLAAAEFEYAPDGYTDLAGRSTRVTVEAYDPAARSRLPVQSKAFYAQLALFLSEQEAPAAGGAAASGAATGANPGAPDSPTTAAATAARQGQGARRAETQGAPDGLAAGLLLQDNATTPAATGTVANPGTRGAHSFANTARLLSSAATFENVAAHLRRYPLLADVSPEELLRYAHVLAVVESCMVTAIRFVDLDGDTVRGTLSLAFLALKPLVRRSFHQALLVHIPPVKPVKHPPAISIRVTELHSTLPRTTEVALQHTVLSQLYKQIGSFSAAQWADSPLFKVNLYISALGHAPVDVGGPYRQVWTFLAEEMMRHPDKCFPHTDYHRNPLFVFCSTEQRVCLVPDKAANSSYELVLFAFLGKIMGYAVRAKIPLDIDLSPYVWKFLVDDRLSIADYYAHVDNLVKTSLEDDNFLVSGVAEELIPGFAESSVCLGRSGSGSDTDGGAADRLQELRRVAQECLVHSMDEQLSAIRNGLWSTLPRRVVRCLSWRDLEVLVCGEYDFTVDDLRKYIRVKLSATQEKQFWSIVEEMTGEQRASLLCFASGQRRLPLIRPITVTGNRESTNHLPRAQSCSSLLTIPAYASYDVFKSKLLLALEHEMEMELV